MRRLIIQLCISKTAALFVIFQDAWGHPVSEGCALTHRTVVTCAHATKGSQGGIVIYIWVSLCSIPLYLIPKQKDPLQTLYMYIARAFISYMYNRGSIKKDSRYSYIK